MKISSAILLAGFLLAATFLVVHIAGAKGDMVRAVELTGERVTRTYDLPALKHLDFEGPIRLILTAGMPSVTIEADKAQLAELDDRDEVDDKLTLRIPRSGGPMTDADMIVARVSSPTLRTVRMSGRSDLQNTAPLDYAFLDVDLSGSASVDLAFVKIDSLLVSGSGSVRGMLRGEADYLDLDGSGSIDLDASALRSLVGDLDFSGSSMVRVHADSLLHISGSGSTQVDYSGEAAVNTAVSGSSKVNRVVM